MLTRVSNIETFRRWRDDDEQTMDDLIHRLTNFQPTPVTLAGTAFHKALELATFGEFETLEANGYVFHMPDCELALTPIRELRAYKKYGALAVTGQVDELAGFTVIDHKTTGYFNPDGYLEGCQWRFYLDIFDADVFRWNVFEIKERNNEPFHFDVKPPQILEQCRYPWIHDDCMALASDYYETISNYQREAA